MTEPSNKSIANNFSRRAFLATAAGLGGLAIARRHRAHRFFDAPGLR